MGGEGRGGRNNGRGGEGRIMGEEGNISTVSRCEIHT